MGSEPALSLIHLPLVKAGHVFKSDVRDVGKDPLVRGASQSITKGPRQQAGLRGPGCHRQCVFSETVGWAHGSIWSSWVCRTFSIPLFQICAPASFSLLRARRGRPSFWLLVEVSQRGVLENTGGECLATRWCDRDALQEAGASVRWPVLITSGF